MKFLSSTPKTHQDLVWKAKKVLELPMMEDWTQRKAMNEHPEMHPR